MKNEVYSWRISQDLKQNLEREARRRRASVSSILDTAAREWLAKGRLRVTEEEEQKRLHAAAAPFIGAIAGGNPRRSQSVREIVRARLRRSHGR
jgi:hypothetical protein